MRILLPTLALLLIAHTALAATPVTVSIVPQQYFLERIAGDLVDVTVMVVPGASPATYEPKPRQMAALAKSEAYFAVGVPFELAWLPRFKSANPDMKIVRTHARIKKIPMAAHTHHGEDHNGHGEHDHHGEHHDEGHHEDEKHHDHDDHKHGHDHHEGEHHSHSEHDHEHCGHHHGHHHGEMLDPHIWLDPALVKVQAGHMLKALVKLDPAHAAIYRTRHDAFLKELDALDAELRAQLAGLTKRGFLVYHPAWGYFAKAYGLEQAAIEVQGAEPSPRELAEIMEHAREENVGVIFIQPQFARKSAEAVARHIGARVAVLDPLAEDWDDNLRRAAKAIIEANR